MKKIFLILFSFVALTLSAQLTVEPAIIEPGYTGQVVITYNPRLGNGEMASATKCFAHTGLITSESQDNGDWKYVIGEWRKTGQPELTRSGDSWVLTIPNIYTFYGAPESTEIVALAFVFHDGPGGQKAGRASNGGNLFIFIGEETVSSDIWDGFTANTVTLQKRPERVSQGIYYDPDDPTAVTLCTYAASKTKAAKHVFLIGDMTDWKLSNDYQLKRDGKYFWIRLTGLEPGRKYRFQYAIERSDGVKKQISDLYSEELIHPQDSELRKKFPDLLSYPLRGADGYVTVIQPGKEPFAWSSETLNFQRPSKDNLIIYESWVYDFSPSRTFNGMLERLDYIENLGVNVLELMPVNEFDNNKSWGYDPNHYFAVDKAYGSGEDLKHLIDECHKRGIAVVLDMVFNHASGNNPMNKLYPYGNDLEYNPWFNEEAPHPNNVFEDWNHDFEGTREMTVRALQYWLIEYKVDGFRLDLSHGLSGPEYDATQNLLYYYQNGVQAVANDAYMILEHWDSWDAGHDDSGSWSKHNSEVGTLVDAGMMCWRNASESYQQVVQGWLQPFGDATDGLDAANEDRFVTYTCSHDEERPFFKAKQWGDGNLKNNEAARCGRVPLAMAFLGLLNGPQMIYHFEELGFDYSKYQDAKGLWGSNPYEIDDAIGWEVKMDNKYRPENWMHGGARMEAYQKVAQIFRLRTRLLPQVFAGNPTVAQLGSRKAVRYIQWGNDVYVVGNFSATSSQEVTIPSGTWYDYLGGGVRAQSSYTLAAGEVKVLTGSQLVPPAIPDSYDYSTPVPAVSAETTHTLKAEKRLVDGRVLIIREGRVYDALGRRL